MCCPGTSQEEKSSGTWDSQWKSQPFLSMSVGVGLNVRNGNDKKRGKLHGKERNWKQMFIARAPRKKPN